MVSASEKAHTILLVQPLKRPESKTFADYESVQEALEGICKMFEEHLKRTHPEEPTITYDIAELFEFIDSLPDLCCLVMVKGQGVYRPHPKEWIKNQTYEQLKSQAKGR
ncbi:enhancer of rudimentary homolog [Symsagittifera roscoffensis]|uniref:enhancer of rudimentary homolog n=1 Tax=Symsagittifera roscoffensis TaxID=84072 RepID=UPI00307C9EA4